jgi:hypothetical protein
MECAAAGKPPASAQAPLAQNIEAGFMPVRWFNIFK